MYIAVVALTMLVLPSASVAVAHALDPAAPWLALVGRWFVFWGVGVRLTLAGARQLLQPGFTAKEIFHMTSDEALPLVSELGVANLATGVVGLLSLAAPTFTLPVAIAAGIFYGVAGLRHLSGRDRSRNETVAMAGDLFLFAVLAIFVLGLAAGWVQPDLSERAIRLH
jgi:hypothetical protein